MKCMETIEKTGDVFIRCASRKKGVQIVRQFFAFDDIPTGLNGVDGLGEHGLLPLR